MSACPQGAWSKLFKRTPSQDDPPKDEAVSWAAWAQKYTPGWPSVSPGWPSVPGFVRRWGKAATDKKDP